eukprot:4546110-Alexandrium_andersonii.AAC.1
MEPWVRVVGRAKGTQGAGKGARATPPPPPAPAWASSPWYCYRCNAKHADPEQMVCRVRSCRAP